MTWHFGQKGISIIEIVVVVALIGVLVAVVVGPLSSFRNRQAIQNSTNALVSVLNEARTKTLAAVNNTQYSVQIDSASATLFTGSVYNANAADNYVVTFDAPVTASAVLNGGGSNVTFDRLKGTTSQHGTITLSISGGESRTVTVSASGTVARN